MDENNVFFWIVLKLWLIIGSTLVECNIVHLEITQFEVILKIEFFEEIF